MTAGWAGQPLDFHFVMDSHAHLGQNDTFLILDSGAKGMLAANDRLGIDVAAISSLPSTIGGWTRGNDAVIDAIQAYPDRFFGYITVNAHDPSQVQSECERCWSGGCRGLKLHSAQGINYDRDELRPALEFADAKRCPVLFHVWGRPDLQPLEELYDRYENCRFVLAHAACCDREAYVRAALDHPNAYLETCVSWCPKGVIEYFVKHGLEDKILWGSDAGFFAAAHQLGRVLFAEVSPKVKQKILSENARTVFFGSPPSGGSTR